MQGIQESPWPGIEPAPQQSPEPQQWWGRILNMLSHKGAPKGYLKKKKNPKAKKEKNPSIYKENRKKKQTKPKHPSIQKEKTNNWQQQSIIIISLTNILKQNNNLNNILKKNLGSSLVE